MYADLLVSLPFIFIVSILAGLAMYLLGGVIAPKGKKTVGKVAPYACGEELPPRKFQVDVKEFLIYAVYFLIFDIFAFTLATSLSTPGYFPAVYALIVLMAVVLLAPLRRRG
jgi:NADH:ubiquinone oxidoreductase subunit 3 (subunit A)